MSIYSHVNKGTLCIEVQFCHFCFILVRRDLCFIKLSVAYETPVTDNVLLELINRIWKCPQWCNNVAELPALYIRLECIWYIVSVVSTLILYSARNTFKYCLYCVGDTYSLDNHDMDNPWYVWNPFDSLKFLVYLSLLHFHSSRSKFLCLGSVYDMLALIKVYWQRTGLLHYLNWLIIWRHVVSWVLYIHKPYILYIDNG